MQDLSAGRHPSLVQPDIKWINPHRWRKITKHISRGARDIGGFYVWVEFPTSGVYRKIGPVRVVHAGYVRYYDAGQHEHMVDGLNYIPSTIGDKKCDLYVLVFDWAGERHVRRVFAERHNDQEPGRHARLMKHCAMKVALTTSKDERSMFRRITPWKMSES